MKCKYCYMYELTDQSWMNQPKLISSSVLKAFLFRLDEYFSIYDQDEFLVVIHGGEPLLAGISLTEELIIGINTVAQRRNIRTQFTIQTNSLLLNDEWISLFKKYQCIVGISHDGPSTINDEKRILPNGKGTAKLVEEKINYMLTKAPEIFSGCLTVINPLTDGSKMVEYFYNLGVRKLDFLLPDQNYIVTSDHYLNAKTHFQKYTNFLLAAYDSWRALDDPDFDIRIFRELVMAVLGKPPVLDSLGATDTNIFVLETDGGLEPLDTFKCCGDNFTKLNLNVFNNSIFELEELPIFDELAKKSKAISAKCKACDYLNMCGGGYMPHRYDGKSFSNPSIYCSTLFETCKNIDEDIKKTIFSVVVN